MKFRNDFVTNSSSSNFIITNLSNKTMTSKDVAISLVSKMIEDSKDRFVLEPGESIQYTCGDGYDCGLFENFIYDMFYEYSVGESYGDGNVAVDCLGRNN